MKNNTKNIRKGITAILFAMVMIASVLPVLVSASISPETVEAELCPCERIIVEKEVHIELPEKADVIFAFDLTGSMSGILDTAKAEAQALMDCVDALGVDVNYGVMSYMDYPDSYDYCGYSDMYGSSASGDYAYQLDQPLTSNQDTVVIAINALTLGYGGDGPQDYTRIMYESYADTSVGWRTGAKKLVVNFGDNVPHDCNLNEGVTDGTWTTGGDPGRDEVMDTADDLDLQTVLAAMDDAGVTLLECHTEDWPVEWMGGPAGFMVFDYWDYWTGITGGGVYLTTSDTLVKDVCTAIEEGLTPPIVYGLHLQASAGYVDWLELVVPASYDELETPVTVPFEETIHVPLGTECGVYTFTVSAMDDKGVNYGDQTVTIDVPCLIPVDVDIKPGSCPNPLNKKSKGVLPVAVLGTEDFDVTTIDPETIELTRVAPIRWSYEDVATPFEGELCDCHDLNGDGYMDLTLKFDTQELVETLRLSEEAGKTIPLTITGNLIEEEGGTPIEGEDCIWVLKLGKSND
jgi:hypothetical protein